MSTASATIGNRAARCRKGRQTKRMSIKHAALGLGLRLQNLATEYQRTDRYLVPGLNVAIPVQNAAVPTCGLLVNQYTERSGSKGCWIEKKGY